MGTLANRQPYSGGNTTVRVALGDSYPGYDKESNNLSDPINITLTADIAVAATTAAVSGVSEAIPKGTFLLFEHPTTGVQRMYQVAADVTVGSTSISIVAAKQPCEDTAVAKYPPEVWDRSAADLDVSTDTEDVNSLNTGRQGLSVATTTSRSISLPGYARHDNPGLAMLDASQRAGTPVWISIEYPKPEATGRGEVRIYKGVVTSSPKASPADGFLSQDFEIQVSGAEIVIPPTFS